MKVIRDCESHSVPVFVSASNGEKGALKAQVSTPEGRFASTSKITVTVKAWQQSRCSNGAFATATDVPSPPAGVTLLKPATPENNRLSVNVNDRYDGGLPITSFQVKFFKEVGTQVHLSCEELTGGEACLSTRRSTDADTCKKHGLNIVVPRSKDHWAYLKSEFPEFLEIVPEFQNLLTVVDIPHMLSTVRVFLKTRGKL